MGSARRAKKLVAGFAVAGVSVLGFTGASVAGAQSDDGVYVTPSSTIVSPPTTTPTSPPSSDSSTTVPAEVLSTSETRSSTESSTASAAAGSTNSDGVQVLGARLARTGQDNAILVGIGLAAVVLGGIVLTLRRRVATR